MIWNSSSGIVPDTGLVSHIKDKVDACGGMDLVADSKNVEEIAKAVDAFINERQSSAVDSRYVVMLAAKALSSIGEGQAARRLLLYGTGLIVPSEWEVTGGEEVWVLDLKQITVRDNAPLEIIFFNGLNVILDSIADVWDQSKGEGTLGLRHVSKAALALLGGGGTKKQNKALESEIRSMCRSKLDSLCSDRGWSQAPKVMDLDA